VRRLIPSGLWQVAQLAARLDGALVQSECAAHRREAKRWRDLCERNAGWRDAVVGRLIRPQVRCAPCLPSAAAPLHRRTAVTPPWLAQRHTVCGQCLSHCCSAAAPRSSTRCCGSCSSCSSCSKAALPCQTSTHKGRTQGARCPPSPSHPAPRAQRCPPAARPGPAPTRRA
jgi:hypothetical protein